MIAAVRDRRELTRSLARQRYEFRCEPLVFERFVFLGRSFHIAVDRGIDA